MTTNRNENLPSLEEAPSARVRDVAMAFIGLLPGASFVQLLADQIWEDPRNSAQKKFALHLARRLIELEARGDVDLEEILSRQETQPLLIHAFDAVSKSIGENKLEALRNAATQGIFERGYSFDLSVMVFSLLERLTEGHLKIFRTLQDYRAKYGGLVGPSRSHLAVVDVPTLSSSAGMREPKETVIDGGGFTDNYLIRINNMLIDDLINMGLIELVGGQPTGPVSLSPTGPQNIPYTVHFTDKGKLVYEHIFTGAAV